MQIATAADAARVLGPAVTDARGELLAIAYVDASWRLLDVMVAPGDAASVPVPTRAIAEAALRLGAAGLIVAHNHPSGDPRPSEADLVATRRLSALAQALGVRLHDHLIFAGGRCHSLRASGLL